MGDDRQYDTPYIGVPEGKKVSNPRDAMNNQAVERHLDMVDQRLSAIESEQHRQAGEIAEIKGTLSLVHQRLSRIDGRMGGQVRRRDDQSRTMAALIPQRLAAVPQGS